MMLRPAHFLLVVLTMWRQCSAAPSQMPFIVQPSKLTEEHFLSDGTTHFQVRTSNKFDPRHRLSAWLDSDCLWEYDFTKHNFTMLTKIWNSVSNQVLPMNDSCISVIMHFPPNSENHDFTLNWSRSTTREVIYNVKVTFPFKLWIRQPDNGTSFTIHDVVQAKCQTESPKHRDIVKPSIFIGCADQLTQVEQVKESASSTKFYWIAKFQLKSSCPPLVPVVFQLGEAIHKQRVIVVDIPPDQIQLDNPTEITMDSKTVHYLHCSCNGRPTPKVRWIIQPLPPYSPALTIPLKETTSRDSMPSLFQRVNSTSVRVMPFHGADIYPQHAQGVGYVIEFNVTCLSVEDPKRAWSIIQAHQHLTIFTHDQKPFHKSAALKTTVYILAGITIVVLLICCIMVCVNSKKKKRRKRQESNIWAPTNGVYRQRLDDHPLVMNAEL